MQHASRSVAEKLAAGEPLSDQDIERLVEELDSPWTPATARPAAHALPGDADACDAMMLPRFEQDIRVSEHRCTPGQFVLQPGGCVTISVERGSPQQAFSIGRDVEEAFVTPVIPPGCRYEWLPHEPGRYFVASEVYPHLRSSVQVLQEEQQDEATSLNGSRRASAASGVAVSARSSTSGGEPSLAGSASAAAAAVDEPIRFPALAPAVARPGATLSRATQTGGAVSRQTCTDSAPLPFRRFGLPPDPASDEEEGAEGSVLDAPPESGLRRRSRGAAPAARAPQRPASSLPPLGRPVPLPLPGIDQFSVLSNGSGGSPRSGSGSERSAGSMPLYVQRPIPGGILQPTRAFSGAGRSSYSESRSGASDETQPLLYSVGQRGPAAGFSSGSSGFRAYSPAAPPSAALAAQQQQERAPQRVKCPRCQKEFLSTINQRRCISSHLGKGKRGSAADIVQQEAQLAAFWDGLEDGEKRALMDLRSEHHGEHLMRQLEIQQLHRKRSGSMDQLTPEQRRLHACGQLLHAACAGGRGAAADGGASAERLSGVGLVRVLGEVSEGTFLHPNTISKDEFCAGNNLEAGLGALVAKRLLDAQLAAKQRQAERMQQELEDQEAAAAGGAAQKAGGAGKKKAKSKGKAGPTAKPAGKPAPDAGAASEPEEEAAGGAEDKQPLREQQLPQAGLANGTAAAAAAAAAAGDEAVLSPPRPGAERYDSSPQKSAPAPSSSSFTNFLFAEEAEGAGGAAADSGEAGSGWRMAGNGRSSRASQAAGSKPPKPAAPRPSSRSSNGASAPAERHGPKGSAGERHGGAAAAVSNKSAGAAAARQPAAATTAAAAAGPSSKQQAPPARDSFPALPATAAAATSKPAAATAPGSSYAAAASKLRKEGSSAAAAGGGSKAAAAAPKPEQQPKPAARATGSLAQQPKSWLVPGSRAAASAPAAAVAPATAAAGPAAAASGPVAAAPAAIAPQPAAEPPAVAYSEPPSEPVAAAAPTMPAAAVPLQQQEQAAAAAEAPSRPASVTPPISDAGSPPPAVLLPPGSYPVPAWPVGPDGMPMPPPPAGFYWGMMPPPPPGMQFGGVEMGEALPAAGFAYPYFLPGPYPPLPPGHPGAPGMPGMPAPHMTHCGSDGQLAPFPPGMPMPLPPQTADELDAAAVAAEGQPAGGWGAAPEPRAVPEPPDSQADAQEQQQQQPAEQEQPDAEEAAAAQQQQQQQDQRAPRKPFLAMLQEACGTPAASQPAAAREGRRRGAFDPAAAAAELERRWHAAAPRSVPASSLPQPARSASPTPDAQPRGDRHSSGGGGVKPAALPQRGSSGSLGGGKPSKAASGSAASSAVASGRSSPATCGAAAAGATKPVVVAVRAWSSDDSATDGQPKWRIQSAKQGAEVALQQAPESASGAAGR